MISAPSGWSACVFFFLVIYTNPFTLSTSLTLLLFTHPQWSAVSQVLMCSSCCRFCFNKQRLVKEGTHHRKRLQTGKIDQKGEIWRDERKMIRGETDEKYHTGKKGWHKMHILTALKKNKTLIFLKKFWSLLHIDTRVISQFLFSWNKTFK